MMVLGRVLVLLASCLVVYSLCPGDCNHPYGECVADNCVCVENWAGEDCSIYDQYLNSGEIASDGVTTGGWKYYRHHVGVSGVKVVWEVNQTAEEDNDHHDADVYVQKDDYPTRRDYLLRNITLEKNSIITLENATAGTYYAGVFGYFSVHYSIRVTETQTCPDQCSGNGDCVQGECVCYPNYRGSSCQSLIRQLNPGNQLLGEVGKFDWEYFNTNVEVAGSTILWTVSELVQDSSSNSDCDLYAAFDKVPSLWEWDYANVTLGNESTIQVSNAKTDGHYTLGVYGFFECSFRVSVEIIRPDSGCPDQCSNHGDCHRGECRCHPGFEGDLCEWMDPPLGLGESQIGFVEKNSWNYYNARVVTQNALLVNLTQVGEGEGDCDLYVRADDKPTRFDYDYVDLTIKSSFSILIQEPGDHTWYFGVLGWSSCSYSIQIDETLICACGFENTHGDCREGFTECFCHDGWTGPDCNAPLVSLENKEMHSNSVKKLEWRYFELFVANSTTGVVSLKEKNSSGLLWLFVSFTGPPSLLNYDLSEKETNHDIHEISIATAQPQTRPLYVAVYGNPFGTHDEMELEFDLIVWSAPF
mmetsp:Transcript_25261/g.34940  ORF Transcript_25261/g.34940 Transcript_25261/m.34940 type:complete len:586 (-) Transcript_25261:85-1842(-)